MAYELRSHTREKRERGNEVEKKIVNVIRLYDRNAKVNGVPAQMWAQQNDFGHHTRKEKRKNKQGGGYVAGLEIG